MYTYTSLFLLKSLSGVIAMISLVQAFVPLLLSLGLHFNLPVLSFARFLWIAGGSAIPHLILVRLLEFFSFVFNLIGGVVLWS